MENASVPKAAQSGKFNLLIGVAGGLVLLDLLTKEIVRNTFYLGETVRVIPGFFNLTYIHNPGAAFGFLASGNPAVVIPFFVVITLVVAAGIVHYYRQAEAARRLLRWGLSLILGGAVGNLIDRVRFQSVVDFLDFYVGNYHWPAFNAADSAISVGVGLILLDMLLSGKTTKA